MAADHAKEDSDIAQATAKQFAPDFKQPGLDRLKPREPYRAKPIIEEQLPIKSILTQKNEIPNQVPNQVPINNPNSPQQVQQIQLNKKPIDNYQPVQNQYIPSTPPTPIYQNTNQINVPNKIENQQNYQNNPSIDQQIKNLQPNPEPNRILNSNETNPTQNIPNNPGIPSIRRNSKILQSDKGNLTPQLSIDHFDHYKRPPSRDSSVDRYTRAAGRMGGSAVGSLMGSRQPSVDKNSVEMEMRSFRAPSVARGTTPLPAGNGSVLTGSGVIRYTSFSTNLILSINSLSF